MKKINWVKFHTRDFSLFRYYVYVESNKLPFYKKHFGKVFDYTITVPDGKLIGYFHDQVELDDMMGRYYNVACEDFITFEKYAKQIFGWMNEFIDFNKKFKSNQLLQYNNKKMLSLFDLWYKKYLNWQVGIYFYFTLESIVTDNFSSQLENYLRNNNQLDRLVDWSNIVMSPEKMNTVAEENKFALQTAIKIKQQLKDKQKLIKKYYKKFLWIPCYDIKDNEYDIEYFEKRIEELLNFSEVHLNKQLKELVFDFKQRKTKFKSYLKEINDKELKELSQVMHWLVFYKDHRDDLRRQAGYVGKKIMKVLATNFGLSLTEVNYLTPDEIREWLNGKPISISDIKKRIPANYVLLSTPDKIDLYIGEDFKKVLNREFPAKKIDDKVVKGLIGCKGMVSGKVVIVRHSINCIKVNEGDILVAVTTHPEYVPAMKKAAAFVTDEGGITSHAAIVAREMNKPCIVGTKIATKIFKDGDIVEVDADSGIIRKI
ncbi:MAG TPA: hypothetical protein DEB09_00995 [Candidatus Magasanikbacteria bacterium]|nr:hypothetical protein [Candidatus Magasanikbacteria bacterium]